MAYSCYWYGRVLSGNWLVATHTHTWWRGLVDPNSIVYALLDVNVCNINEMKDTTDTKSVWQ